jgi:hypothetical protein
MVAGWEQIMIRPDIHTTLSLLTLTGFFLATNTFNGACLIAGMCAVWGGWRMFKGERA